jgi:hypothetical protein
MIKFPLVVVGVLATGIAFAGTPPQAVPIDGGVSLLAAAGVGYGIKKYRDSRKKRAQ